MMRAVFVLMIAMGGNSVGQDIVFSRSSSLVGRIAHRITGGDHYTHVGIVLDGFVYEADYPRVRRVPIERYGKRRGTYDYYAIGLTAAEKSHLRRVLDRRLGEPYRLRGYFFPGSSRRIRGTWCSPFVGEALQSIDRLSITADDYHEPQDLFNALANKIRIQ